MGHFTLGDHIIDIAANAAASGADLVELDVLESADREFRVSVRDNGRGMNREEQERAKDPLGSPASGRSGRPGLGIPFLILAADQSGGGWGIRSDRGGGTEGTAWFDLANIDTQPEGDLPGVFRTVLLFDGLREVLLRRKGRVNYELKKTELVRELGELNDAKTLILLDRYLRMLEKREENYGKTEFGGSAEAPGF
jgi:glycerophosphoryl diester phosphodiesterase